MVTKKGRQNMTKIDILPFLAKFKAFGVRFLRINISTSIIYLHNIEPWHVISNNMAVPGVGGMGDSDIFIHT